MTKDTFLNAWSRELSIESMMSTWDAKRFLSEFYDKVIIYNSPTEITSYGHYDGQSFLVGTKLTALENGELIIAPEGTPPEQIVGVVTLNGLETKKSTQ